MSIAPRSRTGSGPLIAGLIILVVVAAAAIVLYASGATPMGIWDSFFPVEGGTGATDRAHATKSLYDIVFYIAAAIFVVVELAIVYTVFRYRRKPGDDTLPPQTHGNNVVEVIWTAIPTAIVALLFVLSWQTLNTVDASVPTDVHIRAVAARFQWSFDYLDGPDGPNAKVLFSQSLPVGDTGGMFVPVGEAVTVSLRSMDVNHAFYVPKFLFKRDAIPGKENIFSFTVDDPGTYRGQCAELCGPYHGSMIFDVHAVPRAQFDAWMQDQIKAANATPAPSPSGAPTGTVVELAAQGIAFTQTSLQAPADQPFTIHFKNEDKSVPHDVQIKDGSGSVVFTGDTITGPAEANYAVPALKAGSYTFVCTIHPNMTGTITVQ
jgi:cytochrome c oxidase subunit 2